MKAEISTNSGNAWIATDLVRHRWLICKLPLFEGSHPCGKPGPNI